MHGKQIRISVEMQMPQEVEEKEECCEKRSVEEEIREALELIDSGHDSKVEWLLINRVYKAICGLKRPNERARNIKQMIEPVLAKYGYHKVTSEK